MTVMKLVKVKLRNFRCYRDETEIHLGDLSCFIGRNDVGKSSTIEALDGFFNDNIDKGDLSTGHNDSTIEITCFFEDFPEKMLLDSTVESSLAEECLLNSGGLLEIKRVFKISNSVLKEIYVRANHPSDERIKKILSMEKHPAKRHGERN